MDENKTLTELLIDLLLNHRILVPQNRYEELVRAETERNVLEATICGENNYNVNSVMGAIKAARKKIHVPTEADHAK